MVILDGHEAVDVTPGHHLSEGQIGRALLVCLAGLLFDVEFFSILGPAWPAVFRASSAL